MFHINLDLLIKNCGYPEWIGLTKFSYSFKWDDGTPYSWTHWNSGDPEATKACVAIKDGSSKWYSRDCEGYTQNKALALCMATDMTAATDPRRLFNSY